MLNAQRMHKGCCARACTPNNQAAAERSAAAKRQAQYARTVKGKLSEQKKQAARKAERYAAAVTREQLNRISRTVLLIKADLRILQAA